MNPTLSPLIERFAEDYEAGGARPTLPPRPALSRTSSVVEALLSNFIQAALQLSLRTNFLCAAFVVMRAGLFEQRIHGDGVSRLAGGDNEGWSRWCNQRHPTRLALT